MLVRIAAVLLSLALLPAAAHADKRVALVVGNSAYQHTAKLANPKNDATDLAGALRKHGFQVIEGFDLDKAAFDRKVRDFATALQGSDVGVFFYAGHGLQVAGQNYLVPVDAELTTAAALEFEMVRVDVVHRVMERQTNTNVLFLDACRDNPLARNLARAMGTRSAEIGRGLAPVESGVGTLISFSTQPGNVALDGAGRNSPFAGALVKHMAASNDDLSAILIAVRNDVMKETQRKQVPWEHSALTGRFYFNPPAQAASPAPAPPTATAPKAPASTPQASATPAAPARQSEAAEAWAATKDTTNATVLEAFITRYKDTFYAELARARIEELKRQQAPAPASTTSAARPAEAGKKEPLLPALIDQTLGTVLPSPAPGAPSAPKPATPPGKESAEPKLQQSPTPRPQAAKKVDGDAAGAQPAWMAPLVDKDKGRFERLSQSRAKALERAARAAGDNAKALDALRQVRQFLAIPARPLDEPLLVGRWRCRAYTFGGTLGDTDPEFAASVGTFFECRISRDGTGLAFHKITGSMKKQARLVRIQDDRMLYYGTTVAQSSQQPTYPDGDAYGHEVGVLDQLSPTTLRIELPEPNHYASAGHEVVELVRQK